jgi:DNA repair protein RadC
MKIKDLQNEEKPREKMISLGAENLTNTELLAIILRSGGKGKSAVSLSRELFIKFGNIKNLLSADIKELTSIKNIDLAKATSIKALEELSKRYLQPAKEKDLYVKTPQDAYEIIKSDIYNKEQEYLFLLTLDNRNKLISKDLISKGTINETLIHPREIFKTALAKNACSIILIHNHPSNKPDPSNEDITVTKRIFKAGINIGIPLTDHLVVTNDDFVSMKSQNLIGF